MAIRIIEGKEPIWETDKYDVVLVGISTYCRLTNGYLSKLRFKYPEIERVDSGTQFGDSRKLGTTISVGENPVLYLMYVSGMPYGNRVSMDYDALRRCLMLAAAAFKGRSIMSTIHGCTGKDGNADKETVLGIMRDVFVDVDVDVYDTKFVDREQEMNAIKNIAKAKGLTTAQLEDVYKRLYLC